MAASNQTQTATVVMWPGLSDTNVMSLRAHVIKGSRVALLNRSRAEAGCTLLAGPPPAQDGAGRLNGADYTKALGQSDVQGDEMMFVPWNRCMRPPSVEETFGSDAPVAPPGVTDLEIIVAFNQVGLPALTAAVGGWIPEEFNGDRELVQPETWVATDLSPEQAGKLVDVTRSLIVDDIGTKPNAVSHYLGL